MFGKVFGREKKGRRQGRKSATAIRNMERGGKILESWEENVSGLRRSEGEV